MRWAIIAAQHRNRRQAAEALNIRQSTLSRSLRGLEYQLGATLFERTAFRAYWRQANSNPSLAPFLDILRERYPDISGALAPG